MDSIGKISLIVEGNIGVGKSTFLKILTNYLDICPVFEPSQRWQNVEGENLLDLFYKDTPRWAYTFQSYAFVSRVVSYADALKSATQNVLISERSVFSDRYCFAKNLFELGAMNQLEWQLYKEWFTWLVYRYTILPTGFIYLRNSPENSFERMQRRRRAEEVGVSLDYLKLLYEKHESWLVHHVDVDEQISNLPVLILQCDRDFEHNIDAQLDHVRKVVEFYGLQAAVRPNYQSNLAQKQI